MRIALATIVGALSLTAAQAEISETMPLAAISLPWIKVCAGGMTWGQRYCLTRLVAACEMPFATAAFLEQADGTERRLSIDLPEPVMTPRGARLVIDRGRPMTINHFLYCYEGRCRATYDPGADDIVTELKNGQHLVVEAEHTDGRPIRTVISLAGFAAAYDASPVAHAPDPVCAPARE